MYDFFFKFPLAALIPFLLNTFVYDCFGLDASAPVSAPVFVFSINRRAKDPK